MPTTGSTADRGYGGPHQAERKRWAPKVERGEVECHAVRCLMPNRRIEPGQPWDLGHTPDRSGWTGPEHELCNRSEGATRGNLARTAPQPSGLTLWWLP